MCLTILLQPSVRPLLIPVTRPSMIEGCQAFTVQASRRTCTEFSSTGAEDWHHLDAGAVFQQVLDFPCIGF